MNPKKTIYNLYIYHNDIYLGKYKTTTDDIFLLNKYLSEDLIRGGMEKGYTIYHQILVHYEFAEMIAKQRINCEKVRSSDLLMLLHSQMALHRFGKKDTTDFLFLKKKVGKNINGCLKQR
tara:strand:- start:1105 stop:1464 length:360 start_codon:yes stop_codon:yes gene_type:complete